MDILISLGNCWFVAAVATLAGKTDLLERIIPPGQGFGDKHKGRWQHSPPYLYAGYI